MKPEPANLPEILVVDDDQTVTETMHGLLSALPARVVTRATGNAAIDYLVQRAESGGLPIDLLILDMWVPPDEGKPIDTDFAIRFPVETLRSLGLLTHSCPVIVFTSHPNIGQCAESFRAGAYHYMEKTSPGCNNAELLFEECRRLLYPQHSDDPIRKWLAANGELASRKYNGKVLSLYHPDVTHRAGVSGELLGGYTVVACNSSGELAQLIVKNRVLRWVKPLIIDYSNVN